MNVRWSTTALPEFVDAGAFGRDGLEDRRAPLVGAPEVQHLIEIATRLSNPGTVGLVDDEDVGDLEQPGLVGLHGVTPTGIDYDDRRVGRRRDLHLHLSDPDGLDEHQWKPRRAQNPYGVGHGQRESAEVPARRHRANENVSVGRVALHPDAVAQDRPAGEGRTRVDAEHAHLIDVTVPETPLEHHGDHLVGQGRLAGARRSGDTHHVGRRLAIGQRHRRQVLSSAGLHERQQPCQRRARTAASLHRPVLSDPLRS